MANWDAQSDTVYIGSNPIILIWRKPYYERKEISMLTKEQMIANHDRVVSLLESTNREGIDSLVNWLENSDFFTAPASHAYHGSYDGGLCEHSLNVYDEVQRIISVYKEINVKADEIIISSLLHDLCKVNFYVKEKRNRKNKETNQWESYDAYTINEKFSYGGHGSKSVFLAQNFIKLTMTEAIAINCHMGCWDGNKDVGRAYEKSWFAWLLHVADESATYIKEGGE